MACPAVGRGGGIVMTWLLLRRSAFRYWLACMMGSLVVLVTACTSPAPAPAPLSPPQVTFYHWETKLAPDTMARQLLDSFACDRLYVKAFDLSWRNGQPATDALVDRQDAGDLPELVPVVFITNEVFSRLSEERIPQEAEALLTLAEELFPEGFPELQIDCDWTARTQEPYFVFLQAVQALRPELEVTCTVRLHQYRDRKLQGIPPVKRATLMAYNTGDLNSWETENSIYDSTVVSAYLKDQPPYPIKLDMGVAVYDWAAVYRRDRLAYLINEPDLKGLSDTERFRQLTENRYSVVRSTYLNGIYLYAEDLIRVEGMSPQTFFDQVLCQQYYVKQFSGQRIMVFRLGSRGWRGL